MNQLIFSGKITKSEFGENWDTLFVGDSDFPLSYLLEKEQITGRQVSVRYWISKREKTKQELMENNMMRLSGALEAEYNERYSDITGYLWTDEELNIGGHDLLKELSSEEGNYLYLEIDIH